MSELLCVLAVDPGTNETALVIMDSQGFPIRTKLCSNVELLDFLRDRDPRGQVLAVEEIRSYGMAVGATVFTTVMWAGRFIEAWGGPFELIGRIEVKSHVCRSARARDSNIRAALIDRFGGSREKAIGTKAKPGPLYGFKRDLWAALAVAITQFDRQREQHHAAQ